MKNRRSLTYHEVTEQWGYEKSDAEKKLEYYRDANGKIRAKADDFDDSPNFGFDPSKPFKLHKFQKEIMDAVMASRPMGVIFNQRKGLPEMVECSEHDFNEKFTQEFPPNEEEAFKISENERRKNEAMEVEPPQDHFDRLRPLIAEEAARYSESDDAVIPDFRVGQVVSVQGAAAVIDLRPIPSDRGRLSVKPLCGSTECASVIVSESDLTLLTSDDGYDVETGEVRRGLFMGCPLEMTETREVDLKTRRVISTIKRVEQPKEE